MTTLHNPTLHNISALTVPGYDNSGPQHWHTFWEKTFGYRRVVQNDWLAPTPKDWCATLEEDIRATAAPVVLIAHSCGSTTVAALATRCDHAWLRQHIQAALLVAPADTEQPGTLEAVQQFGPMPRSPLPFPSLVVASNNDPYITTARAQEFVELWGSALHILPGLGHINSDSNLGDWPEGQSILHGFLQGAL